MVSVIIHIKLSASKACPGFCRRMSIILFIFSNAFRFYNTNMTDIFTLEFAEYNSHGV